MKKLTVFLVILAMSLLTPAYGAETEGENHIIGITPKVVIFPPSLGVDLTLNLGKYLNLRGGYNGWLFEKDFDIEEDGIEAEVDAEINIGMIPLLLDWHPFGGGFRLSGGVVLNNSEFTASVSPGDMIELDGIDYELASLDGELAFDDMSYFFGLGYGNAVAPGERFNFFMEFGLMYHQSPEVSARATASNPTLQALLDADLQEEVAELQDDIDSSFVSRILPVISFGMSIAF